MASNFAEAMQQGYAFGAQQRENRERRSRLEELAGLSPKVIAGDQAATERAYAIDPRAAQTYQGEGDRRREQLVNIARGWKQVPATQRQAYYERFVVPAVSPMGFGDLGQYDEATIDGLADQILAASGGAQGGAGVQSTFVDNQGNRVAIMRDGSTQILGQNAPNNQIIDTGNGFFGVNKGSLNAAPVMMGGQPQQPSVSPGNYQTAGGLIRVGDLTPDQQAVMLSDIQAGQGSDEYRLPQRDASPQQYGGQLRSAPKPVSPIEAERLRLAQAASARADRAEQRQVQAGAVNGRPPTEDERKAAGWLNQATFALQQMDKAIESDPEADSPGLIETYSPVDEIANRSMSADRQRYSQASSSFAEAALRAATGAGINEFEAKQKIRELTPQRGDSAEVKRQKRAAAAQYIESLRARAGRAVATNQQQMQQKGPAPGTVEAGYRFRGGNPADPASWEKL